MSVSVQTNMIFGESKGGLHRVCGVHGVYPDPGNTGAPCPKCVTELAPAPKRKARK